MRPFVPWEQKSLSNVDNNSEGIINKKDRRAAVFLLTMSTENYFKSIIFFVSTNEPACNL